MGFMMGMHVRLNAGLFLWLSCGIALSRASARDAANKCYLLSQFFDDYGCNESNLAYQDASNFTAFGVQNFESQDIFECAPAPASQPGGYPGPPFPHFRRLEDRGIGWLVYLFKDADCSGEGLGAVMGFRGKCIDKYEYQAGTIRSWKLWCHTGPLPEGYFDGSCLTLEAVTSLKEDVKSTGMCFSTCKDHDAISDKLNELSEDVDRLEQRLRRLRGMPMMWSSEQEEQVASTRKASVDTTLAHVGSLDMLRRLGSRAMKWSSEEEAAENKKAFDALFEPGNCASSCDEHGKKLYLTQLVAARYMDCGFRRYWHEGDLDDVAIRL